MTADGPDLSSDIVYTVIGNSPAPTYFSIDNGGQVTVLTDLTRDNLIEYTVSGCQKVVWLYEWLILKYITYTQYNNIVNIYDVYMCMFDADSYFLNMHVVEFCCYVVS